MGTNYYIRFNICDYCDRYEKLHIGKSSCGWTFTFHAVNEFIDMRKLDPKKALVNEKETQLIVESYKEWKNFIDLYVDKYKTAKIFDEYGDEITPKELIQLIESKKDAENNHTDYYNHIDYVKIQENNQSTFKDEEGNSFIIGEFG